VQAVTNRALEVTAIHLVIGFKVTDHWFDSVAALDEFALKSAQALGLTAMDDCQSRVVAIHTPVAKIDHRRAWFLARVLHENGGLLDLFVQRVLIKRRTGVGSGSDDQVALGGDRDADLRAKLERHARLPLAEALQLGRKPAIELG